MSAAPIWDQFCRAASARPEAIALRFRRDVLTYADLAQRVESLCSAPSPLDSLPPGAVVACSLPEPADLLALLYACTRLGLVVCPLDPRLKPAERARLLDLAQPAVYMETLPSPPQGDPAGRPYVPTYAEAPDNILPVSPHPRVPASSLARSPARPLARSGALPHSPTPPLPHSLFYLGFTSGSTGRPKGILRTQDSWACSFDAMSVEFGLNADDRVLVAGSLAHSFFLTAALHALSIGAEALCADKFVPARVAAQAARGQATVLYLVPTMARRLVDQLERRGPLESVRTVIAAGARWSAAEKRHLRRYLPYARILEYYGSSEMGFVSVSTPTEFQARPGSVGRAFHGVEITIQDRDGRVLGQNQEGTIHARSPYTFARLLAEPSHRQPRSEAREWVSSGDRGYLDEDGFLYLSGREDEQINVGGQKVFASEVEGCLLEHPEVAEALVVALPDSELGSVVGALVRTEKNAQVSEHDLQAWLRARLSTFKLPRRLALVPRLPRTLNGKPALARARTLLARRQSGG